MSSGHTPGPWTHYSGKLRPQYPIRIHEIHGLMAGASLPGMGSMA